MYIYIYIYVIPTLRGVPTIKMSKLKKPATSNMMSCQNIQASQKGMILHDLQPMIPKKRFILTISEEAIVRVRFSHIFL